MTALIDFSKHIDKTAVITDNGICFSYRELRDNIAEISKYLKRNSLLFCLCENSIGSLLGYCAFIQSQVVPVMLDATKDTESLNDLMALYKPNYLWIPSAAYDGKTEKELYSVYDYTLVEYNSKELDINKDLALLLTTSGSTGSPKLVRLSYDNIVSNAQSIAEYLDIDSNERPITSLPMHYSYGLSVINSHLSKGATILMTDKPVIQKEFWAFAKEQKATSIAGVPYTYEMLRRLRIFKMDLPHLRTFTQAGGKLSPDIVKEYIEQANAVGKRFVVMYGQTEATARMSYLPYDRATEKFSSIGIAIPGGEFKLIDSNGLDIMEPDVDGELVYIGRNVSMGYAECLADLQKGDENQGVLKTGDIARFDADGYYYITGRLKRFVKIYGNRVNLDSVEQLIKKISINSACVGIDDKITIFTTDAGKEDEFKDTLMQKTGLNNRAFAVQVIESIPKNTSGKVQYAELQKLLS